MRILKQRLILSRKGVKLVEQAVEGRFELAKSELKCLNKKEQGELTHLLAKLSRSACNDTQ